MNASTGYGSWDGDLLSVQWVPSHIKMSGNEQVDNLAEECRRRHRAYVEWLQEVGR